MRRRRHRSLLIASLAAAALGTVAPRAWGGGNTQFRDPANLSHVIDKLWDDRRIPIHWVMSSDGLPGSGIGTATLQGEITTAFDAWKALPTSRLDFQFDGLVPVRNAGADGPFGAGIDGRNLITFTDPDFVFPTGVLAVTITTSFSTDTVITNLNNDLDGDGTPDLPNGTYPAGSIFDGDIVFNSSEPWSVSGASGTIDVRAVALHEAGHFFGLCHSMIRTAVMWPFLAENVAAVRAPTPDEVAWASFLYPQEPAFSAAFGAIRGRVTNGLTGAPVLGAHVYTVDPLTGTSRVGTFSGDDGSYVIPGLAPGSYLVAIEPLDGDPVGLDPFRINDVVRFTFDTNFPEEFYDANEGAVEADPLAGLAVAVSAGSDTTAIDIVTNTLTVPGVTRTLRPGYNLLAYPVAVPADLDAPALLRALGDASEVNAVDRFVPGTSTFERAQWVDGAPGGASFPVRRGEAYAVHMTAQRAVAFSGGTDCPEIDLVRGLNLVGIPCPPAGYTAHQLLQDVGAPFEVERIERFDPDAGAFAAVSYDAGGAPTGADFPIVDGEGYAVTMLADKAGLRFPSPSRVFPPVITGLSPGRGVPGTIVLVLGANFDPDPTKDVVTFNGAAAGVVFATSTTLTVTVPAAASSGPVRVAVAGRQSNTLDFVVEPPTIPEVVGGDTELVSGQTAEGTISADGEQDRYVFTALAGSLVTVTAQAVTPGVPDLVLVLEDPFGVMVASDDNSGGGTTPRINNFQLQTTGTHTIVVSNVPGSGTGAYRVTLTIATHSGPTQVSILGGNFQTAVAGTVLPVPLEVFVTGATGAPLAGVPVTFVATNVTLGGSSVGPADAGTVVLATNASGIVTIQTTLSGSPGTYEITVTVDGAPAAATFNVAATNTGIASVTMSGDQQTGTVGQALASPLEIVIKAGNGSPVLNGLVAFLVAGGNGTLSPSGGQLSDAAGRVTASFKLGTSSKDPQIVAAFVPGRARPLLFEAFPKADAPTKAESIRSNFNRMTLGVSVLNALWIRVTDMFDNPVAGALVSYSAGSGLTVDPGLGPNGAFFPNFLTNADGLHVAMVTASASATPTIDEFGNNMGSPQSIVATVGGAPPIPYNLDIDMGPTMVTASAQNASALIGQHLPGTVEKQVIRFQRVDIFKDVAPADGKDDDDCEFTDEDFSHVTERVVKDVDIDFSVRREDGEDEAAAGFQPTQTDVPSATTDATGIAATGVMLGDIGGVSHVIGKTAGISVIWYNCDGTVVLHQQAFISADGFAESTNVVAIPVVITTTIDDPASGIDFLTLLASLNGNPFFTGATPPAVLPKFPERLDVIVGGTPLAGLNASIANDSHFPEVKIVYQPARPKLMGSNTVRLQAVKDRAQNQQSAATVKAFSYP